MRTCRPLRALFVSEGGLGGATLGHIAMERSFRQGFSEIDGVETRFVQLPEMARASALLAAPVPGLNPLDLDLNVARWHAVQAARVRWLVQRAVEEGPTPDIVHVNSHTIAFGLGRWMRRIPTVLSVDVTVAAWHRLRGRWRGWCSPSILPSRAAERRVLHLAAAVVAMTEWTRDGAREEAPGARIEVIHPGVDTMSFVPGPRGSPPPLRLLFVGGRFEEKGGLDLLDALSPWLGHSVLLDVVTKGGVRAGAGVRPHRLAHGDPTLIRLYQEADLLCLPTHVDAVPLVVPEALACGTPVLVSQVGGLPDLAGRAGIIVAPGDRPGLRAALQPLVADPRRITELRPAARLQAEERFDSRRQAERLMSLFDEIVTARRIRP